MKNALALALVALTCLAQASPERSSKDGSFDPFQAEYARPKKEKDIIRAFPFRFTSTFSVWADPSFVMNFAGQFTSGLKGCEAHFYLAVNRDQNVICYNITLDGFRGDYWSKASTATHIKAGDMWTYGPPRISLPNPVGKGEGRRTSVGCLQGPFKTGFIEKGKDTGEGFHVKMLEDNPRNFHADIQSSLEKPGAVRGQLRGNECN